MPTQKPPSPSVTDALLGVAVGDAIGVPFEFNSRERMQAHPATGMTGYGTHNQAPGTWSDDSSLTFCLAESLVSGYDLQDIATSFVKWKEEAYWSAQGKVFDIGMTTARAISRLKQLVEAGEVEQLRMQKYYGDEYDNGNGSLMRILPLLFYINGKPISEQFAITWEVSALTHRHIRAAMSCLIYLKLAERLLEGDDKGLAYSKMRTEISEFWETMHFAPTERKHFERLIQHDIRETPEAELRTGGYVIEVLESSIWFFLQKESFADTILSIVNLGHDTDTSAAITGGLAGLYYGQKGVPEFWIDSLARLEDITDLGQALSNKFLA